MQLLRDTLHMQPNLSGDALRRNPSAIASRWWHRALFCACMLLMGSHPANAQQGQEALEPLPKNLSPAVITAESIPKKTRFIEVMDLPPAEPAGDDAFIGMETSEGMERVMISDPNAVQETVLEPIEYRAVEITAMNKVTARAETISGALGTVMRFNNLEIIAHKCQNIIDHGERGSAALLEVWELKTGESPIKIFQRWMVSTSPALSSLEHPLYDIRISRCMPLPVTENIE